MAGANGACDASKAQFNQGIHCPKRQQTKLFEGGRFETSDWFFCCSLQMNMYVRLCIYIFYWVSYDLSSGNVAALGSSLPPIPLFIFFFFLLSKVTFYWTLHFITETLLYKMLNAVNNDCKQTNQEKPHSLFFNITFI